MCIRDSSGAVFAATNEAAVKIASKIDAGAISINECALTAIVHDGEKNSFKYSGMGCLLYTSPSPRDRTRSRMPSSA